MRRLWVVLALSAVVAVAWVGRVQDWLAREPGGIGWRTVGQALPLLWLAYYVYKGGPQFRDPDLEPPDIELPPDEAAPDLSLPLGLHAPPDATQFRPPGSDLGGVSSFTAAPTDAPAPAGPTCGPPPPGLPPGSPPPGPG